MLSVWKDVRTASSRRKQRPPESIGSSPWGCPQGMDAAQLPALLTWRIFLVPNLCNRTAGDAPSEGLTDRRGSGSGGPRTRGLRRPKRFCLFLVPRASQNRPPIGSSVLCKNALQPDLGKLYTEHLKICATNSPIKTGRRLKIFSLRHPVPFHTRP